MATISDTTVAILGLVIGLYLYLYFHEYIHWVAGKLFSGDPNVLYSSWYSVPYPYAVEFRGLEKMPNWAIRVAGISPHIIWTAVTVLYLGNPVSSIDTNIFLLINRFAESIYSTPLPSLIFITASAGAGVSVSPSDLVATLRPDKFREYTGRGLSHSEWSHVLTGRID